MGIIIVDKDAKTATKYQLHLNGENLTLDISDHLNPKGLKPIGDQKSFSELQSPSANSGISHRPYEYKDEEGRLQFKGWNSGLGSGYFKSCQKIQWGVGGNCHTYLRPEEFALTVGIPCVLDQHHYKDVQTERARAWKSHKRWFDLKEASHLELVNIHFAKYAPSLEFDVINERRCLISDRQKLSHCGPGNGKSRVKRLLHEEKCMISLCQLDRNREFGAKQSKC